MARGTEDPWTEALLRDAEASFTAGRLSQSAAAYEQILARADAAVPAQLRAAALNNLGLIAVRQKRYAAALEHFEKALAMESGSVRRAEVMGNIGSVYRDQEQGTPALRWYRQSLALFEQLEDNRGTADQHTNIGYMLAAEGEPLQALAHYRIALGLYVDLKEERKAASVRANIETLEAAG
jgi:tetratricopeptide (TPR) repeat protein